jgi:hypothetical protein
MWLKFLLHKQSFLLIPIAYFFFGIIESLYSYSINESDLIKDTGILVFAQTVDRGSHNKTSDDLDIKKDFQFKLNNEPGKAYVIPGGLHSRQISEMRIGDTVNVFIEPTLYEKKSSPVVVKITKQRMNIYDITALAHEISYMGCIRSSAYLIAFLLPYVILTRRRLTGLRRTSI